ncbi:X-ray repair cross-complementing protein 5, partial [Quaeritorhiza haematococci]
MNLRMLTEQQVEKIGTVDPVADFEAMVSRKDVDRIGEAISQMTTLIPRLVLESLTPQLYPKALKCLTALRRVCIAEGEGDKFNSWLQEFKSTLVGATSTAGRHVAFWKEFVVKEGITLISEDESAGSGVSKDESEKFLAVDVEAEAAAAAAATPEVTDEMDAEDL